MANSLIPYSFVPGTKAMASEVNANFLALANSVEEGRTYTDNSIENFNTEFESRLEEFGGIVDEKMAPNLSNCVNISNCIIEQPQRIKYTLADGKLTVKAGSVVIVPYGTKDLRTQYPIGSNFLSDKFKVVDTQFTSNGFFVWAEAQQDLVNTSTASTDTERQPYVYLSGSIGAMVRMESGTASTASSTYTVYYNTATNRIGIASTSTTISYESVVSFPFMRIMGNSNTFWARVLQVFNGMGFIGNTFWLDKGVKVLMPDGLNKDGTCKNVAYTTPNLLLRTLQNTSTWTREKQALILYKGDLSTNVSNNRYYEAFSIPDSVSSYVTWLNLSDNTMYHAEATPGEFSKITACFLGYANIELGKIKAFSPRPVVKVADISEVHRLIQSFNTSSKAANGYIKLGDGVIIQWGRITNSGSSSYTVTLPTPYTTTNYTPSVIDNTSGEKQSHASVTSVSTTKFGGTVSTDANSIRWIAIGY